MEYNEAETTLLDKNDSFYINYSAHYKIAEVNLFEDILVLKNVGSIDDFLFDLTEKDINLNDSIAQLLISLKDSYEITQDD